MKNNFFYWTMSRIQQDFGYFFHALHEKTGCRGRSCNLGKAITELVEASRQDGPEKVNDFVEVCKQNRELIQPLLLLSKNRDFAFEMVNILFRIFLGR